MTEVNGKRLRRRLSIEIAERFAIPLALVCLVPSLGAVALGEWHARQARQDLCAEIEKLKQQERAEAWRNFNQLGKNLRILKLERTPEIVAAAKASRDRKLQLNQRKPC